MSRQATNRPINTNFQDLIIDFEGWDFSQFGSPQSQPQTEEPGFLSKLGNSALAIGEGLTMLPGGVVDTVRDVMRGGDIDVNDADALRQRQEREREQAEYARKYQGKAFEGVTDAMNSMPYSLTTMGASLGAGAAGALAGPVAAGATGMAAAGTVAYRATKQQFLEQMLDKTAKVLGRMPTQEEWNRVAEEFDGEATRYGLWEAGPEALSNLFMVKLLGPLGKGLFRGTVGQGLKRAGGLYGEELATETITQMGQGAIEAETGLRDKAPGFLEAFGEIAPATFWQTTLMAGGKKGADFVTSRMRRRADDVNANTGQDDSATPPSAPPGAQLLSEQDVTAAAPYVFEQSPETMPVPVSPGEFISEADAADIDAFVRDYEARELAQEDALMLSEYGRPEAVRFTPIRLALEAGKPVDLLGLPQDAGGFAQGIGGLALPPGTGALPMGTRATGQGPIAPPTDFAGAPMATPFTPRPALPRQAGPSASQGRWAGGRSQLAYGGGMMQGLGFMGEQPSPRQASPAPVMPTASELANTQTAPRADTTAQAEALGMPAPEAVPRQAQPQAGQSLASAASAAPAAQRPGTEDFLRNHVMVGSIPSASPQQRPYVTPQVQPEWNYELPSFVTAQYQQTESETQTKSKDSGTGHPEKPHESRVELLRQLPPESRKEARRLTNAQLRERVRAEWSAVKSDGEGMYFTANIAEENQGHNTASGLSREMVKSAPDKKAKEEAPHAAGRGTVAGNGGEVRHVALPARGSEEGVAGNLPDGEILGRPEGNPPGPQGNSESLWREGSAGTVREEREGSGSRPEKAGRRGTSIKIPNREAEPATYELMEADEVQASHLPEHSFQKNPKYDLENERRYHDEPASQRKVLENAARLDPDFVLKDSVDANNGAPVVDRDGNVLGGNGRTMSVRKAYQTGGERAEAYRAALRERAGELGLNPADVDAMRRPMLVRRLDKAHSRAERQALITAMNDSFTDSKNARASGKTRGDRLSDRSLGMLAEGLKKADTLRQYFDETESAAAVDQLIRDGVIQATERNAYVGADGLLNPDGKRVVEEALRGRIARNYDALARLPADVAGKLDAVIPSVLIAEKIGGPWSVTEPLRDAVDLLSEFRGSGAKEPGIFLGQVNMLTGKTPREQYSSAARQLFALALERKRRTSHRVSANMPGRRKNRPKPTACRASPFPRPRRRKNFWGSSRRREPPMRRRVSMLTSIPAEVWNAIARETRLKTEWARKAFLLTESGMEALEETEADRLERTYPRLVVRGFQDVRPLLLERDAIRSWVRKHPEYGNALPEVNTIAEAVAMAGTDWMYDETEKKQLEKLLTEALTSA